MSSEHCGLYFRVIAIVPELFKRTRGLPPSEAAGEAGAGRCLSRPPGQLSAAPPRLSTGAVPCTQLCSLLFSPSASLPSGPSSSPGSIPATVPMQMPKPSRVQQALAGRCPEQTACRARWGGCSGVGASSPSGSSGEPQRAPWGSAASFRCWCTPRREPGCPPLGCSWAVGLT